jgi:hypothetical protein
MLQSFDRCCVPSGEKSKAIQAAQKMFGLFFMLEPLRSRCGNPLSIQQVFFPVRCKMILSSDLLDIHSNP